MTWRMHGLIPSLACACLAITLAQNLTGAVTWTRKLGGSGIDRARSLALDRSGNTWVVGSTASADFPVKDALQAKYGGAGDAFIAKLNRQGEVIWATYLGGAAADEATRVEVDAQGNGYVAGTTRSTDFPTTASAYQRSLKGGSDAFLVKLSPTGQILYATFFGGTGDDSGAALLLDAAGFTAIAGTTSATDLPTTADAVYPTARGGSDAFVAIFDPAGQRVYATYFGGSGADTLASIALGQSGNLYLVGQTGSANLPVTAGAQQSALGGATDAYLARLSSDKKTIEYVTYLGGSAADAAVDVVVDLSEMVVVAGNTSSANFPIVPAGSTAYHGGPSDAFRAQFAFTRPEAGAGLVPRAALGASLPRALGLLAGHSENPEASKHRRDSGVVVSSGPAQTDTFLISSSVFGASGSTATAAAARLTAGIFEKLVANVSKIALTDTIPGIPACSTGPYPVFFTFGQNNPLDNPFIRCLGAFVVEDARTDADQETIAGTLALSLDDFDALVENSDSDPSTAENFSNEEFTEDGAEADVSHPIATGSGELFDDEVDLSLGGPLPLTFARHYGSNLQTARYARSALGVNWIHSFDQVILFDQPRTQAIVVLARGKVVLFRRVGNNWVLQFGLPVQYQLSNDATAFRFFDPSVCLMYTFATAGQINRIEDVNGNAHTITQGPAGPTRVADGLGRTLDFTYSGTQLTRVTDNTGRTVDFAYTGANLGSATYPDGKRSTYEYTTAGARTTLMTRRTLPEGNAPFTQQFDARGRVTRQNDSRGNSLLLAYDTPTARFTQVTAPTGSVTLHRATNFNILTQANDANGNTTMYEYDFNGHRTGVQNRDGAVTGRTFNAMGSLLTSSSADGSTTRFTYTTLTFSGFTFELPATITYPDRSTERFAYDARGNLTTFTDRAGQAYTFTYTSRGLAATARTPSGGTASATYNADGTAASRRLLTGENIQFEYDTLRRPTRVIRGDNSSQRFTYDARDRVTTLTDGRGQATTFTYDGNGRRTAVRNALQNQTRTTFDGDNRASTVTDPLDKVTRLSYDPVGHLAAVTDASGVDTRLTYDKVGRVTAVSDAVGTVATVTRSAAGILTGLTNGAGQTLQRISDARERPVSIADPAGNQTQLTWNNMNRLTAIKDALGNIASALYDSAGRLVKTIGREGETTQFGYDLDSRVNQVTDPRGNVTKFDRDAAGRLTAQTDPAGLVTRFEYNSRGRRSKITRPDNSTANFTYDENGRLIREDFSDATRIDYTRDNLGRVTSANGVTLKYDAAGRVIESNGIRNEYDAASRLAAIFFDTTRFIRYTYNNRGLLTKIVDWTGRTWDFEYDAALRLTRKRAPNGVVSTYTYGADARVSSIRHVGNGFDYSATLKRDANGRVTGVAGNVPAPPVIAGTQDFAFSNNNRIQGRDYDGRGNTTRDGDRRFVWDGRNRLTRVTSMTADVTIEYDAFGYPTRVGEALYVWNYASVPPLLAEVRPRTTSPATGARSADAPPFARYNHVGYPRNADDGLLFGNYYSRLDAQYLDKSGDRIASIFPDSPSSLETAQKVPGAEVYADAAGKTAAETIAFTTSDGRVFTTHVSVSTASGILVPIPEVQLALLPDTGGVVDQITAADLSTDQPICRVGLCSERTYEFPAGLFPDCPFASSCDAPETSSCSAIGLPDYACRSGARSCGDGVCLPSDLRENELTRLFTESFTAQPSTSLSCVPQDVQKDPFAALPPALAQGAREEVQQFAARLSPNLSAQERASFIQGYQKAVADEIGTPAAQPETSNFGDGGIAFFGAFGKACEILANERILEYRASQRSATAPASDATGTAGQAILGPKP